jgi:two-component system response regulator YesN
MRQAIVLGVADYIKKPIDDQELIESLTTLIERIESEEQEMAHLGSHSLPSYIIALPTSVKNHIIDNAIHYIEKNYDKSVGLQEAAQELHVSPSHLSRLFKELTGINYSGYLNAYRMNSAIQLMHNPRLNISMVCSLSGFPTPGYFTKLFKRFYSMTPSQFRDTVLPSS